jgi:hypothetical protein
MLPCTPLFAEIAMSFCGRTRNDINGGKSLSISLYQRERLTGNKKSKTKIQICKLKIK